MEGVIKSQDPEMQQKSCMEVENTGNQQYLKNLCSALSSLGGKKNKSTQSFLHFYLLRCLLFYLVVKADLALMH